MVMVYYFVFPLVVIEFGTGTDDSSKVKAFGRDKFPGFFRHEFELLRRTKETERKRGGRKNDEARVSAGERDETNERETERRGRERERKRSKDSCYWWLLVGQHASSVANDSAGPRSSVFANDERSAAAFSGHFEHEQLHSSKSGHAASHCGESAIVLCRRGA